MCLTLPDNMEDVYTPVRSVGELMLRGPIENESQRVNVSIFFVGGDIVMRHLRRTP